MIWLLGLQLSVAPPPVRTDVPGPDEIDAAAAAPTTLTPAMKRWVRSTVPEQGSDLRKLRRLLQGLLDPHRFQLTEQGEHTGTASEVYRSRRANCVGFAMLFVGMARELEIPVYFVVFDGEGDSRRGDLLVSTAHLAVGYGSRNDVAVFDFGGVTRPSPRKLKRLSGRSASAVFYSNAGIELLLDGKARAAVEQLEIAVKLDPAMSDAWSNLGVALRRSGARRRAREAYRRALELSPDSDAPRHNLILLSGAPAGE